MPSRTCAARNLQNEPCRQPAMADGERCFWHDPAHAQAAADARRLGGQRGKREGTLAGAYAFIDLDGPGDLKRLLEIAIYDALALDNSLARVRTLVAIVQASAKLFDITELADRVAAIEAVMAPRLKSIKGGRSCARPR